MRWRFGLLIDLMKKNGELPEFPDDVLSLTITTGLEALGRDEEFAKAQEALAFLGSAGPFTERVGLYTKFDPILSAGLTALGFADAVRSDADVRQEQAQQQQLQAQQQALTAAAPQLAQAALNAPKQ